jgi:hypothetical protein
MGLGDERGRSEGIFFGVNDDVRIRVEHMLSDELKTKNLEETVQFAIHECGCDIQHVRSVLLYYIESRPGDQEMLQRFDDIAQNFDTQQAQ